MKKGQAHPAALTSKNMIAAALIELIKEKEFKNITITEICLRSQIARRTFYRNFESIHDVLTFYIKNIINDFTKQMMNYSNENYVNIIEAYFTFWTSHSGLLTLLNRNELTHIIFIEYIKCLEELPFLCHIDSSATLKTEEFPFIYAFMAGGLWSMITYYVSCDCKQTPKEIAKILTQQLLLIDT